MLILRLKTGQKSMFTYPLNIFMHIFSWILSFFEGEYWKDEFWDWKQRSLWEYWFYHLYQSLKTNPAEADENQNKSIRKRNLREVNYSCNSTFYAYVLLSKFSWFYFNFLDRIDGRDFKIFKSAWFYCVIGKWIEPMASIRCIITSTSPCE